MSLDLESELLSYFKQYKSLEEKGGPEQDGELFEEVLAKEEEILGAFGLPESLKYCKILHKLVNRKSITVAAIQKTISNLQKAAEKYHSRPVVSSIDTLTQAQQKKLDAFDVLPELGFLTHSYTLFLYDGLLLENKAEPEAILKELQTLHEQDLYGPVAELQFNLTSTYRRTKAYKELKAKLQFLDLFLSYEEVEDKPEDCRQEMVYPPEGPGSIFWGVDQPTLHREGKAIQQNFKPEYTTLTDLVELEEIIFNEDSAVTVTGRISYPFGEYKTIMLGFDFADLAAVIQVYGQEGQSILSYFNRDRHNSLFDEPLVINLEDKTGSNLLLGQHYFKVYRPLSLNREGKPVPVKEEFFIVEEILNKPDYDKKEAMAAKSELEGWFNHMSNHYYAYLNYKRHGMSEKEARRENGLEDDVRFKASELLYKMKKHGGKLW